jgi:hypothetical protein
MRTTLIDPFEIQTTPEDFADWEQPTSDDVRVIDEMSPRGIGYDGWRRARSWCADARALRG